MKKKILVISRYFLNPEIGGSAIHYYEIISHLYSKYNVTIAAYSDDFTLIKSQYIGMSVQLINLEEFKPIQPNTRYYQRLKRNIAVFFAIISLLKKIKPDIVLSMSLLNTGPFLIIPKFLFKYKFVQTIFGEEIFRDRYFKTHVLRLITKKLVFTISDLVITNSMFITKYLKRRFKLSGDKTMLIQPRLTSDWYKKEVYQKKVQALKNELNISDNDIVLFSIARHIERKGIHRVIETLYSNQRLNVMSNLKYLIAGKGPYTSIYKEMIKKYRLEDRVIISGIIPEEDKIHNYDLCDVFLLPTYTTNSGDIEGYGLVFLEAMGRKKPVIAGDTGGVAESVGNGYYGILLRHEYSNEELGAAILNLVENPKKRSDLVRDAYSYITTLPTIELQSNEIADRLNFF